MKALLSRAFLSPWPTAFALAVGYACASVFLVAASPTGFVDGEELHNATVARELLTGSGRFLLDFQYRPNCGGCTFVSLVAVPVFRLFGVSFLAWKSVPIAFGAAIVCLGAVLLERTVNRFAALVFAVLVLAAPVFLQHIMLAAWGTHYEVMAFVLGQAVLVSYLLDEGSERTSDVLGFAWGLLAGIGIWFCYTSAFAMPALWIVVLWAGSTGRPWRRLASSGAGLAIGLIPLAVFALATDRSPFEITTQSPGDELGGWWLKLSEVTLFRFAGGLYHAGIDRLYTRYAAVVLAVLWTAAVGAGAAAWIRARRERPAMLLAPVLLVASIASYVFTDFRVDTFDTGGPPPTIALRYLFPASLLLLLTAAQGLGMLRSTGILGTVAAVALTTAAAIPGLHCRIGQTRSAPGDICRILPSDVQPFDYSWFRTNRLGAIEEERLIAHPPEDWLSRVNHRRVVGARRAEWLTTGAPEDMSVLLETLRGLPGVEPRDMPALLHGLARALPSSDNLTEAQRDRIQRNLAALWDIASPDERRALAAGTWVGGLRLDDPLDWPLPPTPTQADVRLGWGISAADCAMCPAIGLAHGFLFDVDGLETPRDLFPEGIRGLPTDEQLRLAVIEGRGAAYGRGFGYCPSRIDALAAVLPPDEGTALRRGFDLGRAENWMVPVHSTTPAELVP